MRIIIEGLKIPPYLRLELGNLELIERKDLDDETLSITDIMYVTRVQKVSL